MQNWYMITLIGKDQQGIVASVTTVLAQHECNLGQTSMLRLGDSFAIMMMVNTSHHKQELADILTKAQDQFTLSIHIDAIDESEHDRPIPDVQINIHGADCFGIVAQATTAFADAGLNISNLSSEIIHSAESPIYILSMSGQATKGIEKLQSAAQSLDEITVHISPIDVLIG